MCVHWGLSFAHHKRQTDSDGGDVGRASYFALHPPLPASKAVLSLWSLVAKCALHATGKLKPELEFQAGTSSYSPAGTSSYHALYKYKNIGYVEVPEDDLYNTYEHMNA